MTHTAQTLLRLVVVLVGAGLIVVAHVYGIAELAPIGGWVVGWIGFRRPWDTPRPPPDDPPTPKHRIHALLVLLVVGCGAVPTGEKDVDDLAWGLCEEHGALCVGSSTKADLGLDEYLEDFYWGRYSYGEIEIPHTEQSVPYGVVCWDDKKCAEDLTLCEGVIMHEIGHQEAGPSQLAADCWAIENATEPAAEALRDLVCSWRDDEPGRCAAARECFAGAWR